VGRQATNTQRGIVDRSFRYTWNPPAPSSSDTATRPTYRVELIRSSGAVRLVLSGSFTSVSAGAVLRGVLQRVSSLRDVVYIDSSNVTDMVGSSARDIECFLATRFLARADADGSDSGQLVAPTTGLDIRELPAWSSQTYAA
jgi:hypothetical protein